MNETSGIAGLIYSRLSSDPTIQSVCGSRIYEGVSPENTQFPFIRMQEQGSHDVLGVGGVRILVPSLWLVRAITRGESFTPIQSVADAIDTQLQGRYNVINGSVYNLGGQRSSPFRLTEVDNGVQYRHLGGLYRLWAHKA